MVTIGVLGGAVWMAERHLRSPFLPRAKEDPWTDAGHVDPGGGDSGRYAGSASCKDCHAREFEGWRTSHHGLAERPLRADLDRAAFGHAAVFPDEPGKMEARVREGIYEFVPMEGGGNGSPIPLVRVIGHDPLRQFLVEAPGGRLQATENAWDPRRQEWFNVNGSEHRQPGEWGHWTGRGMNWNSMCGTCHNTRFRKNYDPEADVYRTTMAEASVGCEACHGPMEAHVRRRRARPGARGPDPTAPRWTPQQHMEACAPCHARRSELSGDSAPGEAFWDHFLLSIVDPSGLFYPDGQVKEEDYEFSAFLGSRMHAAGVTCLDCHDPHTARPILPGNALCLRCHNGSRQGAPVMDPVGHSFHAAGSTGSECINCHMPQTVYMRRHSRHDHGFTSPDPLLTRELSIPNACDRCHAEKDAAWALAACERWYGRAMERPARTRARDLATARRGDPSAITPLLAMLTGAESPYWKAAAIAMLERWVERPEVFGAAIQQSTADHPLVRYRAVQVLAPAVEAGDARATAAVRARLSDESRSVRTVAAWALRASLPGDSRAGRDLAAMLALNADQPAGQAQLAVFALAHGRPEEALAHYGKAVRWDPGSALLRHDFAVALSGAGRAEEALAECRETVRLEPESAENHFLLGLALNEVGNLTATVDELREAVRLDPRHFRALYNLGLAYEAIGRMDEALDALARAEQAQPADPRIPYARATVLAKAGRVTEARTAVSRALELDQGYEPALELRRALEP